MDSMVALSSLSQGTVLPREEPSPKMANFQLSRYLRRNSKNQEIVVPRLEEALNLK